jgi:diguanylate cyclase (GGDEF)-like protein/PAS domain S-box-containing protein
MNRPTDLASRVPLGLAYFVAASLAANLTRLEGGIAFLWVATGLLIADLLCRPRREWPASVLVCAIASFFATGLFGLGWTMALPFVAINSIEAVVAAWLCRRQGLSRQPLGSLDWLMNFIFCAGLVAPFIAATMAATAMAMVGHPPLSVLVQAFAGHALGNLMVTPLALLVVRGKLWRAPAAALRRHALEGSLLFGGVAATAVWVFTRPGLPMLFLPVLPVILVTFRLGRGAAAAGIALLALIGGVATLAGLGPLQLIDGPPGMRIQFFQFYLAATVLTVLPVAADLENRRRLHRAMRLSEMRYRLLAEHSTDILIHYNRHGEIRYISPSIRLFGGHDPDALVGQDSRVLVAPEHLEHVRANYRATIAAKGENRTFDFLAATVDGSTRWYETHSRAMLDENGEVDGVLSVVRDVTERKANERQLAADAMTDPLTGLYNRRAFRAVIERRLARPGASPNDCVAMLDIDHFKIVNDSFGHPAGDEVLRGFARLARRVVREHDLIARVGGEEFAIHFPDTSVEQAMVICERLRSEIARAKLLASSPIVRITVSGGVAPLGRAGLQHALETADLALYSAKRKGRDQLAIAA